MDVTQAQQTISDMNAGRITWDDNLRAQANNIISSGGSSGGTDLAATQAQILSMYQKAAEPAIKSYEASIPETQSKFAFERTKLEEQRKPLEQRYQNLLDEITRQQNVAVGATTTQTAQGLGVRGILGSSELYGKTINQAVQPIQAQYATLTKDVGLERENKLMELNNLLTQTGTQEVETIRAIRNAIATLQSGAGTDATNAAINMVNQAKQNEAALAAKRLELESSGTGTGTKLYSLGTNDVLVDQSGKVVYSNRGTGTGTNTGLNTNTGTKTDDFIPDENPQQSLSSRFNIETITSAPSATRR